MPSASLSSFAEGAAVGVFVGGGVSVGAGVFVGTLVDVGVGGTTLHELQFNKKMENSITRCVTDLICICVQFLTVSEIAANGLRY